MRSQSSSRLNWIADPEGPEGRMMAVTEKGTYFIVPEDGKYRLFFKKKDDQ